MEATWKPGQEVPESGIYAQCDDNGNEVERATCVKGEPFPPTREAGYHWKVIQKTND